MHAIVENAATTRETKADRVKRLKFGPMSQSVTRAPTRAYILRCTKDWLGLCVSIKKEGVGGHPSVSGDYGVALWVVILMQRRDWV